MPDSSHDLTEHGGAHRRSWRYQTQNIDERASIDIIQPCLTGLHRAAAIKGLHASTRTAILQEICYCRASCHISHSQPVYNCCHELVARENTPNWHVLQPSSAPTKIALQQQERSCDRHHILPHGIVCDALRGQQPRRSAAETKEQGNHRRRQQLAYGSAVLYHLCADYQALAVTNSSLPRAEGSYAFCMPLPQALKSPGSLSGAVLPSVLAICMPFSHNLYTCQLQ